MKTIVLFCLMTAVLIPSLIASSKIDSISYPTYSIDTEGTKIVTITKSQQVYLTKSILELEKCQDLNLNYKAANILLLEESATCKDLVTAHELQDEASSIIIDAQKEDMATLDKLEDIKHMLSFPKVFSLLYIAMNSVLEIIGRFMQMAVQEIPEGAEETKGTKRQESLDAILEGLSSLENILFWAGIEEDYSYTWLEVNYK